MLNRATCPLVSSHRGRPILTMLREKMERHPAARLGVLLTGILLALVAVGTRLAYLQIALADQYASEFDRTVEKFEPIPSRDGRILAAGGEVLAEDLEVFAISVQYRWLQEPTDPDWLKRQALSRLDRADRRNSDLVIREQERVLSEKSALWNRLERLATQGRSSVRGRRRKIQRHVETVYRLVEAHRQEKLGAGETSAAEETGDAAIPGRTWSAIVRALTTPPVREALEPVVISEQLDYHLILPDVPLETAI